MRLNFSSLFWGLALITTGGLALANEMGYLNGLSATTWGFVSAVASALFFVAFFVNGIRAWGWLFPACIFAGLSATIAASNFPAAQNWIPTLMVGSVALPFVAAFALDRTRQWALIPAFVLGLAAIIPPLDALHLGDLLGAFIVGMLGLPFIVAYFSSPRAWWGIIPGGIMVSIALMIGLDNALHGDLAITLMFIGWMLTFGTVWKRQSRDWAKYPAIIMGILAGIMLLISFGLTTYWALGLIIAGIALIVMSLRPRPESAA